MSINGIFSNVFYPTQNHLNEETRKKLLSLGIDPSTVNSEVQAQNIIASLTQVQPTTNESLSQNTCCTGERELICHAKKLGHKIGVQISETESLSTIINKLRTKIDSIMSNSNDDKITQEAYGCKEELETIEAEYATIKQNQSDLIMAMNISANLNKFKLGL